MKWSGNGSIYMKREKMNRLIEKSDKRVLPTLSEIFSNSKTLEDDFASDLVDKITFSRYPGITFYFLSLNISY